MAWVKAAMQSVSSIRVAASHTRNSNVGETACGRRSPQIFLPVSMQCVLTRSSTKFSYSSQDENSGGTPVRGKRCQMICRYDFSPVMRVSQNGLEVERAGGCG